MFIKSNIKNSQILMMVYIVRDIYINVVYLDLHLENLDIILNLI